MFLPYILNDGVGIYKSFFPIVGFHKRDDDEETFWLRMLMFFSTIFVIIIALLYWEYSNEILVYIYDLYKIILGWGVDKMTVLHNGSKDVSNTNSYYNKYNSYMSNNDI